MRLNCNQGEGLTDFDSCRLFNDWVRTCSQFDEVLTFDGYIGPEGQSTMYASVTVAGKTKRIFAAGDKVTFRRKGSRFYGRVESLLCPGHTKKAQTIKSTGSAQIRREPEVITRSETRHVIMQDYLTRLLVRCFFSM
jgi:hypothetical protein